ncbi:Predicted RNA binding protein YcfA, dsRBD-like fold, HicA-like mRNA interferase family [Streptococcus henryi]|uniref:Predicted RNA binding protein YcfA, dsRBD-like fold, HicA-like mRNA interferase family n=1 Tax=Streptococcus henryi TaxID=439219 RepID=A0A1G6AJB8_9STRE|nr:type II toxin-antitoxin system HicA family toxin [Streptococcus henryi]QBX25303.1 hypothetical protein Javan252_0002 [Streptococcus phage Javan252]SDB08456.1 Predicted RNA binding protein YcfA, dsRBD-like fold, HicA-like mRNA interferase family [Streptococcus henryi]
MNERELKKIAKKQGFSKTNFGKGSHEVWKHPDGRQTTIPKPKQADYKPGTLNNILKVLYGE